MSEGYEYGYEDGRVDAQKRQGRQDNLGSDDYARGYDAGYNSVLAEEQCTRKD